VAAERLDALKFCGGEIAGQSQGGVLHESRMPLAQQKTVTIFLGRVFRIVLHLVKVERSDDLRARAGTPEVADFPGADEVFDYELPQAQSLVL
jgi:hypothetical protein